MFRLYDFQCTDCGHIFERIVKKGEKPACPLCFMQTEKMLSTPRINMGVGPYGYYDETLGTYVHSNRHKRELMRKQGVTPKGDTPKPTGGAWV